jgi:hypothetical protein
MLKTVREFFWPWLDKDTNAEIEKLKSDQDQQIERVRSINFKDQDIGVALDVSEKIYVEESERGKTAENKAFQYLLVTAAIISLLTYFESSIWDGKLGGAPRWLSLIILLLGVVYLVRSALWALRVVSIRAYHVVGASDVADIWNEGKSSAELAKEFLIATIKNQDGINAKVSSVKMATGFLSRAIVTFGALLSFQASWEISTYLIPQASKIRQLLCGA